MAYRPVNDKLNQIGVIPMVETVEQPSTASKLVVEVKPHLFPNPLPLLRGMHRGIVAGLCSSWGWLLHRVFPRRSTGEGAFLLDLILISGLIFGCYPVVARIPVRGWNSRLLHQGAFAVLPSGSGSLSLSAEREDLLNRLDTQVLHTGYKVQGIAVSDDHWGQRSYGLHLATDFAVWVGTPLYMPFTGTTADASDTSTKNRCGKGLHLVAEPALDVRMEAILCHLDSFKSPGSYQAGEIIAYSGHTGSGTGPHLHVQLFRLEGQEWVPIPLTYGMAELLLFPHTVPPTQEVNR